MKLCPEGIDFESYLEANPGHALTGTIEWMRQSRPTYPAYAHKADGGIVCAGSFAPYEPSTGCAIFAGRIPAVSLLDSYTHQVNDVGKRSKAHCKRRFVELMRLDAWLSIVGRMDEIRLGRNDLREYTPAIVQGLINHFGRDFEYLYASSKNYKLGRKITRLLARELMSFVESRRSSEVEALYVVVAALRTAKVGICVMTGSDTSLLWEIFEKDVLVHLVQ